MLNKNMVYKPLCYNLDKIMSVLKTALSILFLFAVFNSIILNVVDDKSVFIVAFLLYSLVHFIEGMCFRYILKNVCMKDDIGWINEWRGRITPKDFIDADKYFYVTDVLERFGSDLNFHRQNELDKHIKDLKVSSYASFFISIITFLSLVIPLLVD